MWIWSQSEPDLRSFIKNIYFEIKGIIFYRKTNWRKPLYFFSQLNACIKWRDFFLWNQLTLFLETQYLYQNFFFTKRQKLLTNVLSKDVLYHHFWVSIKRCSRDALLWKQGCADGLGNSNEKNQQSLGMHTWMCWLLTQ